MAEHNTELLEKVSSIPAVKSAIDGAKTATDYVSGLHPVVKQTLEYLTDMLTMLSGIIAPYLESAGPYSKMAKEQLESLQKSYPSMNKPPSEAVAELVETVQNTIPNHVKVTVAQTAASVIAAISKGIKEQGDVAAWIKDMMTNCQHLKMITDCSAFKTVAESEAACTACKTSTDALLKMLPEDIKAEYERQPDAASKATFLAQHAWKSITTQAQTLDKEAEKYMPESVKGIYDTAKQASSNMPSTEQVKDTMTSTLDSLQKTLQTIAESAGGSASL